MPKNVPTFITSSKLFAHCGREDETHAHPLDVLLDAFCSPLNRCEAWNASTSSANAASLMNVRMPRVMYDNVFGGNFAIASSQREVMSRHTLGPVVAFIERSPNTLEAS